MAANAHWVLKHMPHYCTVLGAFHVLPHLIPLTTLWLPAVSLRILRHRDVKWVVQQDSSRVDSQAGNTLPSRWSGVMNTLRDGVWSTGETKMGKLHSPTCTTLPKESYLVFEGRHGSQWRLCHCFKLGNFGAGMFNFGLFHFDLPTLSPSTDL